MRHLEVDKRNLLIVRGINCCFLMVLSKNLSRFLKTNEKDPVDI